MRSSKDKPSLDELLSSLREAQREFREKLIVHGPHNIGENGAKQLRQTIMKLYPDFYPKLKEIEITQAIELLKTEGYKVLKKVETVEYEEI